MKVSDILSNIIVFFVVLFVGTNLASKFSYNILIQNKSHPFFIFIQHPYLSIKNKFGFEKSKGTGGKDE